MLKIIVAALLITFTYGGTLPRSFDQFDDCVEDVRIVGGTETSIIEAPWQVALYYSRSGEFTFTCSGSIIKENAILTAAHCVQGTLPSNWVAHYGSAQVDRGGQVVDILNNVVHHYYSLRELDYDIAIQITARTMPLNIVSIAAVELPDQGQSPPNGALGVITGWGAIREGGEIVCNLRKASIPILQQLTCWEAYGSTITSRMICAGDMENGGVGLCNGDSGSPMVIDRVIHGVFAYGRGCARPGYPAVFARVAEFRDWIDAQLS